MDQLVRIKGLREGLLIALGDGAWPDVQTALLEHIRGQADFLNGARIALDVGEQVLSASEMGRLRDEISGEGLVLWAVLSSSTTTQKTAQTLGLATRLSPPHTDHNHHSLDTTIQDGEEAILIERTLRSGFSLQHPGHVIVIGDLNPGAEIIAGGNVIVWGHLRGMVHAGATGDENAVVCALDLSPTQLRIAGQIAIPPTNRHKPQPEMASLRDGQVIAELWNTRR